MQTNNVNANNGNVKAFIRKRNDNNNDNDKYTRAKKVDMIADRLVEIFNNPGGRMFYCKLAWKQSEAVIWNNVEKAKAAKKGDPSRLFTYLSKLSGY